MMLSQVQEIALNAGREILRYYRIPEVPDQKEDGSPITKADRSSHQLILNALGKLEPDIPVISEESAEELRNDCLVWPRFWLVDPLDGTKEFLKGTDEFTVNICLIANRQPVLGVVHAPALALTYFAERGKGAWKTSSSQPAAPIKSRRFTGSRICVVTSRDHIGPGEAALLHQLPDAVQTSMGSSLKFCLVAEGRADLYPRFGPTMEWDTAAAQCVVEEAGGAVQDQQGRRLLYQKPGLKNPGLFTLSDPDNEHLRSLLLLG